MTTQIPRFELPKLALSAEKSMMTGVELGVAAGRNAERLLSANPTLTLICIDRWGGDRNHNLDEMVEAYKRLDRFGERAVILRGSFDQYAVYFPDEYFDFVYVDGYAHTGQDAGNTLRKWWPLVKAGGVFSGHDYHPDYQPTIDAVNAFFDEAGIPFLVNDDKPYPSWYAVKP